MDLRTILEIIVPIVTAVIGLFAGMKIEKKKNKIMVKGNNNQIVQDSTVSGRTSK